MKGRLRPIVHYAARAHADTISRVASDDAATDTADRGADWRGERAERSTAGANDFASSPSQSPSSDDFGRVPDRRRASRGNKTSGAKLNA